jgi:hypothetical protein
MARFLSAISLTKLPPDLNNCQTMARIARFALDAPSGVGVDDRVADGKDFSHSLENDN